MRKNNLLLPMKKLRFNPNYNEYERRQKCYKQFALAQYHLGIDITLKYKQEIVGICTLNGCRIGDFEKLIKKLRKVYNEKTS